MDNLLLGLESIAEYAGRSRPTIRVLIQHDGFPAIKQQGKWVSTTDAIDAYYQDKVRQDRCLFRQERTPVAADGA